MKKIALSMLLCLPMLAFGAGWDYYVLNEEGNWEAISPRELNLSLPEDGGVAEERRVMILYNQPDLEPKGRRTLSWIRQVGAELVQEVEPVQ